VLPELQRPCRESGAAVPGRDPTLPAKVTPAIGGAALIGFDWPLWVCSSFQVSASGTRVPRFCSRLGESTFQNL
jgi:hypothetical protein